jgi:hypothetical protein
MGTQSVNYTHLATYAIEVIKHILVADLEIFVLCHFQRPMNGNVIIFGPDFLHHLTPNMPLSLRVAAPDAIRRRMPVCILRHIMAAAGRTPSTTMSAPPSPSTFASVP